MKIDNDSSVNKILAGVFIFMLLILLFGVLARDKECPSNSVENFFNTYKDGRLTDTLAYIYAPERSEIGNIIQGFSSQDDVTKRIVGQITSNLDYQIKNEVVSNDIALVSVKFSTMDVQDFMQEYINEYIQYTVSEKGLKASQVELDNYAHDLILKKLSKSNKRMDTVFDIKLKSDIEKGWLIEQDDNLLDAITGNYYTFLKTLSVMQQQASIQPDTSAGSVEELETYNTDNGEEVNPD